MWFNGDLSPFIFSLEKQIDSDFKYVMERNYFNLLIVGPPLPLNLVYFIPVVLTVFGGKRMNISERLIDKNCSF
jgi:hypothetical protein